MENKRTKCKVLVISGHISQTKVWKGVRMTDLQHEFAHGLELFLGVVLSVKQRVVGHLPQLHHYIAQLSL